MSPKADTSRERQEINAPKRELINILRELERKSPAKAKTLGRIIGRLEELQSKL